MEKKTEPKRPFFSVIVPTHNSAGFIRKGLESIRAQMFQDYELIVVCDNCTDNTLDVVKEYADYWLTPDFGYDGLSRNAGIDIAKGEWILFMDDDDWFIHEFVFQQIHDMAGQHGENILAFSFIWKNMCYKAQTADDMCVAVWSKCWKRDFIGDTRFRKMKWASDADFHSRMFRKCPTVYYWDMPMYYYNFMRPGSQTWKMQREVLSEVVIDD